MRVRSELLLLQASGCVAFACLCIMSSVDDHSKGPIRVPEDASPEENGGRADGDWLRVALEI